MQCHIRGQTGTLFLGKAGILFLPKPSLFIKKESIKSFTIDDDENQRSSRYLDLIVICGTQKTEFGMIERQNKPLLLNYFEALLKKNDGQNSSKSLLDDNYISEEDSDYSPINSDSEGSNTESESGSESGTSSESGSESSDSVEVLETNDLAGSDVSLKEPDIPMASSVPHVKEEGNEIRHGQPKKMKQQTDIMRFIVRKEV
jgi:hypothetical protein